MFAGIDLAQDAADAAAKPDSPALASVAALVNEWDKLGAYIKQGEEALARAKQRRTEIEQERLPAAMTEAGIQSFSTEHRSVVVEVVARGNIPAMSTIEKTKGPERKILELRRTKAIDYVRAHWPGLIKTNLSVSLGKGEAEVALRIAEVLRKDFQLTPEVDESIHHATLNSHFSELQASGTLKEVPGELFALYVGPIAKIK